MAKTPFYKADDVKTPFKRASKQPKIAKLRKSITPGTVLILLAGRFRGRRVVFLKQLASGLLLVTGPYALNGVPLKRVNQAYVIPTSTKVALPALSLDKLDDKYFARIQKKNKDRKSDKKAADLFVQKEELTDAEKNRIKEKQSGQKGFDKPIIEALAKTEHLKAYLKTRFTVRKNTKVHELIF